MAFKPTLIVLLFSTLAYAMPPVFPPSIPLSVRSPYMNVWHISTQGAGQLSKSGQHFWGRSDTSDCIGWQGAIRVDGKTYNWLGDSPYMLPSQVSHFQITPTRSIFTIETGPMELNVTFISPIEPSDWVKQSLPFTYVMVEAAALDQSPHDVQLYMDIRGGEEWASGDTSTVVEWSNQSTSNALYHQFAIQKPLPFQEYRNQAQDGKVYHAMAMHSNLTWQIDENGTIMTALVNNNTALTDRVLRPAHAAIENPDSHLLSFMVDLGSIRETSTPLTWVIGFLRDPNVQYITPKGDAQDRRPYFVTKYMNSTIEDDVIDSVIKSWYPETYSKAVELDEILLTEASYISDEYADLVSLAARQAIATLDITVGSDSHGNANPSDVMTFMKDIGSFRTPRVNPVERIFAAFPMYLYLNASLCGTILRPLLKAQVSLSGQPYASQDLGPTYPIASGSRGDPTLGVEESGNMLIMMYAHARYSGDGSLLSQYYSLTKRWADYLVENTLTPNNQQSADGQKIANMTNLALKGIIGVKAMAEIARATSNVVDAELYDANVTALIGDWESLSLSRSGSHLLGVYEDEESWSMLYNAYADRLLGTELLSQSLLENQTQLYGSLLNTEWPLGLPIDSNFAFHNVSIAWTLFTAATVTNNTIRDKLIHQAWSIAFNNATLAFGIGDQYGNAPDGLEIIGDAGPAAGAIFSLLALNLSNMTITVPATQNPGSVNKDDDRSDNAHKRGSLIGIIAGVVGGSVIVGILVTGSWLWRRQKVRILTTSVNTPGSFDRDLFGEKFYIANDASRSSRGGDLGNRQRSTNNDTPLDGRMQHANTSSPAQESKAQLRDRNRQPWMASSIVDSSMPSTSESGVNTSRDNGASEGSSLGLTGLRMELNNLKRMVLGFHHSDESTSPPSYCDGA